MQTVIPLLREGLVQARDTQGRPLYDVREQRAILDLVLHEVAGIAPVDRILHPGQVVSPDHRQQLQHIAGQLALGVPVQQALGYAWFCDARFEVTPDVLIPRPETAELVGWIVSQHKSPSASPLRILDVGTGSGCIALSLARLIHNSQVTALDLSTAALAVAQRNACQQGVDNVQFVQCDVIDYVDNSPASVLFHRVPEGYPQGCPTTYPQSLSTGCPQGYPLSDAWLSTTVGSACYDVIVSNPPYICQSEAAQMSAVVLAHEPGLALFVPDADPLLFYRAIACYALMHLVPGGQLYFEVNAAYGPHTCALLQALGFTDVELRQDIHGRDRMVRAVGPLSH